jgi:PTH2 family peptidyl-tRNA hydrolase
MEKVKQVIVVRTKYPDNNGGVRKLRTGKLISQAAHASMAFLTNKIKNKDFDFSEEQQEWINGIFTKICCYVESEEELVNIYKAAKNAGLTVELIEDKGLTEFNNVSTKTALAIGPHYSEKIDSITGFLPLM